MNHNRKLVLVFIMLMLSFFVLTIFNEIVDLPHYIFKDAPTSFAQRKGEVMIELIIYSIVMISGIALFASLLKRIKILEGIIPICMHCKKIREDVDWKSIEQYLDKYSNAKLSHSICPDCLKKHYPDYADKVLADMNDKETKSESDK